MIKFALISLLLATGSAEITPLPSARTIAETLKIMRKDNRGLQPTDDACSQLADALESFFELRHAVGFSCDCFDSGSAYTVNCQSEGEICCGEFCGTIQNNGNFSYDVFETVDEQACATFSAPVDIAGQQRCGSFVHCGDGSGSICSCEVEVNGQMCHACEFCNQSEPLAVDCTNIPGFEDFPTDCSDVTEFYPLDGCITTSAALCSSLAFKEETNLQALFGAGFTCNCSDSGSAYTANCQSEGEICCGDFCGTIQDQKSLSYDYSSDKQLCGTFSAPVDLVGEQRCVHFSCGSTDVCSCEVEVNGEMCSACEICREPTQSEPWDYVAVNCTNIPGFNFPTDCGSPGKLFGMADAECTFTPTTSATHPKILPAHMATIFVASSFILW